MSEPKPKRLLYFLKNAAGKFMDKNGTWNARTALADDAKRFLSAAEANAGIPEGISCQVVQVFLIEI